MSQGNDSEWNKLWDLFLKEKEPLEKGNLMDALTASKETTILTRYILHLALFIWEEEIYYFLF